MSKRFNAIEDMCRVYDVKILYAFGSRAEEASQIVETDDLSLSDSGSDLDIGILLSHPLGLEQKWKLP